MGFDDAAVLIQRFARQHGFRFGETGEEIGFFLLQHRFFGGVFAGVLRLVGIGLFDAVLGDDDLFLQAIDAIEMIEDLVFHHGLGSAVGLDLPAKNVILAIAGGLIELASQIDEFCFECLQLEAFAIGRHSRLLQFFLLGRDFVLRVGDDLVADLELPRTAGEVVPDVLER